MAKDELLLYITKTFIHHKNVKSMVENFEKNFPHHLTFMQLFTFFASCLKMSDTYLSIVKIHLDIMLNLKKNF